MNSSGHRGAADGSRLTIDSLTIEFSGENAVVQPVESVSLEIRANEVVGLVGESGSGKSLTALSTLRLMASPNGRIASGRVQLNGIDLLSLPTRELRRIRGREIGVVFQDPNACLNPAFTVGEQISEVARVHLGLDRSAAWKKAVEALREVGIDDPEDRANSYPHQFSGGMRQRVMIAMAIVCRPQFLIADEPTTALDVTTQLEILRMLGRLQTELGLGILFVTHDLGLVSEFCDRLYVMYAGRIVEEGAVLDVFQTPRHPYTEALLRALPQMGHAGRELPVIPGELPSPGSHPPGCRFHPRCPYAVEGRCTDREPELTADELGKVRCVRTNEIHLQGVSRESLQ